MAVGTEQTSSPPGDWGSKTTLNQPLLQLWRRNRGHVIENCIKSFPDALLTGWDHWWSLDMGMVSSFDECEHKRAVPGYSSPFHA